jgi:hypothetical protein
MSKCMLPDVALKLSRELRKVGEVFVNVSRKRTVNLSV